MEIIEQFTRGKIADNSYTEDRLVTGKNCVGVIDGAIGPGYTQKDMITTALDTVVDYLTSLSADAEPGQTMGEVSTILKKAKTQFAIDEFRYTGGFHIVIYHAPKRQVWRVGDCQFRMNGETFTNDLKVEAIGAAQRAVMVQAMQLRGMSNQMIMASDEYAQLFLPFFSPLLDFAHRTDHPLGFGVINGLPLPECFIECHDIPDSTNELVMASDGYPVVLDNLHQTEEHLAGLLRRDPLCIHEHVSSKGLTWDHCSFDDRAYLRLAV